MGAAYLAGLAAGVWDSPAATAASWAEEAAFTPAMPAEEVAARRHALAPGPRTLASVGR